LSVLALADVVGDGSLMLWMVEEKGWKEMEMSILIPVSWLAVGASKFPHVSLLRYLEGPDSYASHHSGGVNLGS
jgi:hypothetical protein